MTFYDLFLGTSGRVFSATMTLLLILIMFFISLKMYKTRRKKTYIFLTVSLGFVIAEYVLIIFLHLRSQSSLVDVQWFIDFLQIISFILVNTSLYLMYNRMNTIVYVIFSSLLVFAVLTAGFHYYYSDLITQPSEYAQLISMLPMVLFHFMIIFACFYMIPARIGQHMKYFCSLFLYFTAQSATLINRYAYLEDEPFFSFLSYVLPIIYFGVILMFMFDRIVELLQATYYSSIRDGLTALYNRTYFMKAVQQYIAASRKISIIFIDIDNFKQLNDTQGHQRGDEVLKQIASLLKELSEDIGLVGRYGGEEIVVLLSDPTVKVEQFAEQIRATIEASTSVTVSVGYCKWRKGISADELVRRADEAMYRSKKTGKNKVTAYRATSREAAIASDK